MASPSIEVHVPVSGLFFFFNDTATTEIYTLSLHDALPISKRKWRRWWRRSRTRPSTPVPTAQREPTSSAHSSRCSSASSRRDSSGGRRRQSRSRCERREEGQFRRPALDSAARRGLMSRMRNLFLPALPALLLAFTPGAGAAQTSLQLRWELVGDSVANDWGASRAAFTLTNRGTTPLPSSGWTIYYNALHSAQPGSVGAGFVIEDVIADLHRLAPATGFAGLAPGASIRIPYLTDLLLNRSFVPKGPYIVFDTAKDVGIPLTDYVTAPFDRAVATPQNQCVLDSATRVIPASELPPLFPTPVTVTPGAGSLRLTALPRVEATEALRNESVFATEYLRPYFASTRTGSVFLRLEVGAVEGQTSPEAYSLVVDPAQGIRIVGVSPAGVFYGLQSLRNLLPAPTPRAGLTLAAIRAVDAPRFGYRGVVLGVARNFHPKTAVLRTIDLLARYKLNVLHLHLTDDEGWRVEIAGLPELTAVGARRGHPPESDRHLQPAFGSGPLVDRPWGSGFYSHADYVEIVRYAAARHLEVIPEIEMPGHARAAIKAMEARFRAAG